ncbi:MAG: DEAD/DEAH box helicase [Deltaproteobacteria bacterium]|nr:DEAD/DEAH box helicase [Deltaproteobacteria bacterium]
MRPFTIDEFIADIKNRKDLAETVHHQVIPAKNSSFADTARPLLPEVADALASVGIRRLFSHQAQGIDLIRGGANVVVMTPAASGKSVIYNIPAVEAMLNDPDAKAIYLFPLKGLEQDQLKSLRSLTDRLPFEMNDSAGKRRGYSPGACEIYDGDTTDYKRTRIRASPPGVLLTNPDMLHLAILPFHQKWERFFKDLKYVIIDEVHTYRGVFGSHVAQVLRRLRRVAGLYGASPRFIACSATIANPIELAETLTGERFSLVSESGAPTGKRNFIFINPALGASPFAIATKLFVESVRAGFKTIAFTKARKITELMHAWVKEAAPELVPSVSSYRAGFLPSERREIEGRLFRGELSGVISTSALELGVDIGGLDVCVLVGYPGTVSSTWQRAGRAGRSNRDSLIAMVAGQDALDQYFMRHPADFFRRPSEAAVIDEENPVIRKAHLLCAASEAPIRHDDPVLDAPSCVPLLEELETEAKVRHWKKGDLWYPRKKYPHRGVSIREAGEPYLIFKEGGGLLGESSSSRVLYDLHPGAIYLHKGVSYRVTRLDMDARKVSCRPADDVNYYTRPMTGETSEIISTLAAKRLPGTEINLGMVRITERVRGFRRKAIRTDENLGEYPLELPEQVFTTVAVWTKADEAALRRVKDQGWSVAGSLHAVEHAAIAALPLFALCDRMDLGGVSYVFNPALESPAVFIYDGHEGGIGLTRRGFECVEDWLNATLRLMEECPCEVSCPSCTQDPKCGNNNDPLDKRGAMEIIREWTGR